MMGQTSTQIIVTQPDKSDIVCEIFSQGVVHASQKLKEYLGFEDPCGSFHPSTDTLTEIFLVNFITFCAEKGVEERIATSKMTKQQAILFGVDWIWTLLSPDKSVRLQIAVQSLQMSDFNNEGRGDTIDNGPCKEIQLTDTFYKNKSPYEKLEEFCRLVGSDCLGLFIVFGLPGKPKDVRGILLDSVSRENKKNSVPPERALQQFILNTDNFLPTREMLDTCMSKRKGLRNIGKVYINFL
ncbi:PREDICTED: rab15 effector protein [Nanorana parkeri]|uniref:rab15 effector protein n=1 Tax=Nanorana parkeri TaxID=125878 RepID=UPI000854CBF4|nr:PREDICTED: rab15 effector protein [Nanorana parkeri]